MTELELYKFVQDKTVEWDGDKLNLWIDFNDLAEFTEMVGYEYFSEGGIKTYLQHNCICIDIVDICEDFGIDPEHIQPIMQCEECGGSGFSEPGMGYDAVCGNCGGKGEHPVSDRVKAIDNELKQAIDFLRRTVTRENGFSADFINLLGIVINKAEKTDRLEKTLNFFARKQS